MLALLFFNLTFIALGSSYVPTEVLLDKEEENKGSSRTIYMRSGGVSSGSSKKARPIVSVQNPHNRFLRSAETLSKTVLTNGVGIWAIKIVM